MYSYDGLNAILQEKGITKTALSAELGISSRTIAKVAGESMLKKHVSMEMFTVIMKEMCY